MLLNDSDPDGDELAVCRVTSIPDDAAYAASVYQGRLWVFVNRGAPDQFDITYLEGTDAIPA